MVLIDTRSIELRDALWFEPRKEWAQLTKSGVLPDNVTFAEFSEALRSIQQDFAQSTDDASAREAVKTCKRVAWPGGRVIRERIAMDRAVDAAARYWSRAMPTQDATDLPVCRAETFTPSQLCKVPADWVSRHKSNGSKAARWQTRKDRIANARQTAQERRSPKLLEAADRLERNNTAVEQAKLAQNVYQVGKPAPEGWRNVSADSVALAKYKLDPEILSIPNSNFRAQVYVPDRDIFGSGMKPQIVFRGTDKLNEFDWGNNAHQARNLQSDYYERAVLIGQRLKLSTSPIEITGHSLGGGLATAASIVSGQHAVTFNPAGLHSATIGRYGGRPEGAKNIDEYVVGGDALSVAQSASFGLLPDTVHTKRHFLPGYGGPLERHGIQAVVDSFETQKREDQAYIVEVLAK